MDTDTKDRTPPSISQQAVHYVMESRRIVDGEIISRINKNALLDLANYIEDMALRRTDGRSAVCPIHPGGCKTFTIQVMTWLLKRAMPDIGVVIMLSRREDIRSYYDALIGLGLTKADIACYVGRTADKDYKRGSNQ